MRRAQFWSTVALSVAILTACSDDADTTTTDAAAAQDTTAAETSVGATFDDPHAIFAEKCTPCHAGGSSGGHNMAAASVDAAYTDSQKGAANAACSGKTKGACALVRIQAGQMPLGRGCSGNPETDAANASCLTAAQQATLKAWIDGGQNAPR